VGLSIRRAVSTAAIVAVLLMPAAPAHAIADFGGATADGPVPWTLTAECSLVVGFTTDIQSLTFVVKASAHAEGPAFGTRVACSVYDEEGDRVGGCSGALFGPTAACTDTVTMEMGQVPSICVTASAIYATGVAAMAPCP
jgi:hypothetical protein